MLCLTFLGRPDQSRLIKNVLFYRHKREKVQSKRDPVVSLSVSDSGLRLCSLLIPSTVWYESLNVTCLPYTVYSLKVTFHRGYMASHTLFGFFLFRSEQFSGWNWESNILTFRQPEVKFKCLNSQMKKPKSSSVDGSNSASFLLHVSVVYHFAPSCMMLFKAFA